MGQNEALAVERRARMAAERLLQQKQSELFAANAELSKHALTLTGEIVEKRGEIEAEKQVSQDLRGQNDQVKQDLEQANVAVDIAERRLWDSVETIEDGFAVFDPANVLIAANSAYLSVFDGMELVTPGIEYFEILDVLADEGIVDTEGLERVTWCQEMQSRWQQSQLDPRTIKLWNGQFVKLVDRRSENGDTVSLALNITETIQREDQLKDARNSAETANRAKSAFLAKMSHELRTPMNGVVGMADLLVESALDDEQQLYVDTIKSSGEALLSLINDVLDFSKMEAAKLVLHEEPFDLERTLTEVLMLFQPAVMQKDIELLIDYDMFLPTGFIGDSGRIRQILTNLMGNAVKFTDSGHVLVRVIGVPKGDDENLRIHITIEDTGPGIAPDMVDHIFGEFNQVEDEKNRRFEGTGLGLAITKQLVELMNGKVWVDSEVGQGSSFGFHINLKSTESVTPALEQVPNWIKRVVMLSQPSQFARILSNQLRVLGVEVADVTIDHFLTDPDIEDGDVVVIDQGRVQTGLNKILDVAGNTEMLTPVIVLQTGNTDELAKRIGQTVVLKKPVERRGLVKAFAELEPPLVDSTPIHGQNSHKTPSVEAEALVRSDAVIPPEVKSADAAQDRKMRILAAEDNKTNRLVFSKMVGKLNVQLEFAENGEEAVAKWQEFRPDLIFMDISMPVMDGKEATAEIRKREGAGEHTPICALTAHAMSGDDQEILAAGLDHYLTKPLRKPAIFEQIRNAVPASVLDVFDEPTGQ